MQDSFQSQQELVIHDRVYQYHSLPSAEKNGLKNISQLPFSLKILLENLLRHEDGQIVTKDDLLAFENWLEVKQSDREISYFPSRVLMQDFTGVPAVVDLAAMRDTIAKLKGDPHKINPQCRVDLVIDHSVQVEVFGRMDAFQRNVDIEMQRNYERYTFLKWGQQTFQNFRVVPPGTGICHQVNLEYLAECITSHHEDEQHWVYPDTLVGTDSHTTMINGLGVLGWGVGGIEAEAAMLGQPISMLIPEVVGFRLTGHLNEGVTATDLVLTITQILREKGVVGKFVEFFGEGLKALTLADRATIANMAPEYGATCGLFPIDRETIRYLELTNRDPHIATLVESYAKIQGMWHEPGAVEATYSSIIALDLKTVEPSLAGPKRPQDRVSVPHLKQATDQFIDIFGKGNEIDQLFMTPNNIALQHGHVVIAAITSCTNTSNPSVMLAAGLLAKKAFEKGLQPKSWVKSSLAPGSKVVSDYLDRAGLMTYLEKMGFYLVGYGCTTCIGNSGPLPEPISKTVAEQDLLVCSVLSGNRNFEGRIHPQVKGNWLTSPPLVVAFALAGTTRINLSKDPLGHTPEGVAIYLRDIWPHPDEITAAMTEVSKDSFRKEYAHIFQGDKEWADIEIPGGQTYTWNDSSTYIKKPPFFDDMQLKPNKPTDIKGARILAILGDSVTTDHISPAGSIKENSPAGKYLIEAGVAVKDFNSYGARRGNHEVMMRGTFANIRLRNEMLPGTEGGYTKHFPNVESVSIYDAAMAYKKEGIPLVVIAGKEYGTGSSRDWAAKGTFLLGIKAIIAESYERIHRSNLIGMGVLPLVFQNNITRKTLGLDGSEIIEILGLEGKLQPKMEVLMRVNFANGQIKEVPVLLRIDTQNELEYYLNGGILQYVLRKIS